MCVCVHVRVCVYVYICVCIYKQVEELVRWYAGGNSEKSSFSIFPKITIELTFENFYQTQWSKDCGRCHTFLQVESCVSECVCACVCVFVYVCIRIYLYIICFN